MSFTEDDAKEIGKILASGGVGVGTGFGAYKGLQSQVADDAFENSLRYFADKERNANVLETTTRAIKEELRALPGIKYKTPKARTLQASFDPKMDVHVKIKPGFFHILDPASYPRFEFPQGGVLSVPSGGSIPSIAFHEIGHAKLNDVYGRTRNTMFYSGAMPVLGKMYGDKKISIPQFAKGLGKVIAATAMRKPEEVLASLSALRDIQKHLGTKAALRAAPFLGVAFTTYVRPEMAIATGILAALGAKKGLDALTD